MTTSHLLVVVQGQQRQRLIRIIMSGGLGGSAHILLNNGEVSGVEASESGKISEISNLS